MWWLVGIGLELCSTIAGTIGKQLIRKSSMLHEEAEISGDEAIKQKSVTYLSGGVFTNTACSPLLEMSAYAFAAQSTIAPFGGLDTVWNAIAAPYTLGEELTWRRIAGVS